MKQCMKYYSMIDKREKYWIQTLYKENPSLSLNILQTQLLRKENNDGIK